MKIKIFDTTLRDGEQQACINFSREQKIEMALLFNEIGFDYIGLMPCQNSVEDDIANILVSKGVKVLPLTPLNGKFINESMAISSRMTLFQAGSDDLLKIRYKTDDVMAAREKNKTLFHQELLRIQKESPSSEIFVGLEDVVNADRDYVLDFIKTIEPQIKAFIVADSKGTANPDEISSLMSFLKDNTSVELGIHTHNDLGKADENAIAGMKSGATILNGTLTGIGERAGNCNIKKVLLVLKENGIVADNVDYSRLEEAENMVKKYAKRAPSAPKSPEAFWHETGIHVNALLADPTYGYNAIDPKTLGFKHRVFFGKKSGVSNFKYFLGDGVSQDTLKIFLLTVKEASIERNKTFTAKETMDMIKKKHPIECKNIKFPSFKL